MLPIIEHVFHCITHFSCQILSSIHAFVLHTNELKVDADYIPELCFFSRDFGSKRECRLCTTADNRKSSTVMWQFRNYLAFYSASSPTLWVQSHLRPTLLSGQISNGLELYNTTTFSPSKDDTLSLQEGVTLKEGGLLYFTNNDKIFS